MAENLKNLFSFDELFKKFKDTNIVFTSPNSDPGNLIIKNIINKFCKRDRKSLDT